MDWTGCELVEVVEGKVSGVPLVKGTRIPADAIVSNFNAGSSVDEVAENYPGISIETLRGVLQYATERLGWDAETLVDWSGCELVERVVGRCAGAPTIVGTRIFPDTIAEYYWSGGTVEEILEDYPTLSAETILGLIRYVKSREASAA
jgi:uncharacterized protein (DUF433 family)